MINDTDGMLVRTYMLIYFVVFISKAYITQVISEFKKKIFTALTSGDPESRGDGVCGVR